jgi:hypothetical protein
MPTHPSKTEWEYRIVPHDSLVTDWSGQFIVGGGEKVKRISLRNTASDD